MLNNFETAQVENIIRESRKGLKMAIKNKLDGFTDAFQKIIDDARYLLPDDNRFKRDY